MSQIILFTEINAPIEVCFDLSTSIDLHKISASNTQEEAIGGRTEGMILLGETVTWRAKHFGLWHKLKVEITEYDRPNYFVDEMIEGLFKYMRHKHEFEPCESGTLMKDTFEFSSPLGYLGTLVDSLILKRYLTRFLKQRNKTIKEFAENDKWKGF